ncbi:N-acetyltransferase B complex non catalytic subunit-domain-containing protein [Whalleya microplaca]|nr:N-acetyltransferase B complex non catalytic subunit-domain-containing protein [Whalleya microplaca]
MVKDNVTIKDADTLDLYEFACHDSAMDYPATIGLLRTRLVKAIPKDQISSLRCFSACLWYSDWRNAQQIAASLHKNFPRIRRFQFQYILATHILAQSDTSTEKERNMFAGLSKALADKAFAHRGLTPDDENQHDRILATEDELHLWYDIRTHYATVEENVKLFLQPNYGPLAFLEEGFVNMYQNIFCYLEEHQAWDALFQIGSKVLETAIRISQGDASSIDKDEQVIALRKRVDKERREKSSVSESLANEFRDAIKKATPNHGKSEGSYLNVCCEYFLYTTLIDAAKRQPNTKQVLKQLQKSLTKLGNALARSDNLKPLFRKNRDVALLRILYARNEQETPHAIGPSTQVTHLIDLIVDHYQDKACFGEAVSFIRRLSQEDVAAFLETLGTRGAKSADVYQGLALVSLRLKIRYFLATTPKDNQMCQFCKTVVNGSSCDVCLISIATSAIDVYRHGMGDNLREKILDTLSELALTGAACLLQLAGIGRASWKKGRNSPIYDINIQLFLQAILWLESYVMVSNSMNGTHRMFLVKLYLLMGCVSRAKAHWAAFDIKNAIVDSLALLFIDRLSSISPGFFTSSTSRDNPMHPYLLHFTRALKRGLPNSVLDCIDNSNYGAIPDLYRRVDKLTASCTTITAVVEERRGLRSKGSAVSHVLEDEPLMRNISVEHDVIDLTNYEILAPELTGTGSTPLYELLSYGPLPTSGRAHLGLLAERFLDFICYVVPKEYKPSKTGIIFHIDWEYALASCSRLEKGMCFLLAISGDGLSEQEQIHVDHEQGLVLKSLTTPEVWYHRIVWRLAKIVKDVLKHGFVSSSTNETREDLRAAIKDLVEKFEGQTHDFLAVPEGIPSKIHAFHGFAALHAMGMLRETALTVKYTTAYLVLALDKLKVVDKTRGLSESAWLAPELKKLTISVAEAENTIKNRIKLLKTSLNDPDGWQDRLNDWTFGDYTTVYGRNKEFVAKMSNELKTVVSKEQAQHWADEVGESWREVIKGWSAVKFD